MGLEEVSLPEELCSQDRRAGAAQGCALCQQAGWHGAGDSQAAKCLGSHGGTWVLLGSSGLSVHPESNYGPPPGVLPCCIPARPYQLCF